MAGRRQRTPPRRTDLIQWSSADVGCMRSTETYLRGFGQVSRTAAQHGRNPLLAAQPALAVFPATAVCKHSIAVAQLPAFSKPLWTLNPLHSSSQLPKPGRFAGGSFSNSSRERTMAYCRQGQWPCTPEEVRAGGGLQRLCGAAASSVAWLRAQSLIPWPTRTSAHPLSRCTSLPRMSSSPSYQTSPCQPRTPRPCASGCAAAPRFGAAAAPGVPRAVLPANRE